MGQLWSLHRDILKRIRIFLSPLLIYIISKCAKNGKHCSLMAVFTIEQSATQTNFGLTRGCESDCCNFFFICALSETFLLNAAVSIQCSPTGTFKSGPSKPFSEDLIFFYTKGSRRSSYEEGEIFGAGETSRKQMVIIEMKT